MSDNESSSRGKDSTFSKEQLEAIAAVVEKVVDKALSKRGKDSPLESDSSASGTGEAAARRSHPPVDSGSGSSSGTAPGKREWASRARTASGVVEGE